MRFLIFCNRSFVNVHVKEKKFPGNFSIYRQSYSALKGMAKMSFFKTYCKQNITGNLL